MSSGVAMADRMKILALSYLFPNPAQPNYGVFVRNRLAALSRYADITVVNPLPWSPLHRFVPRFSAQRDVPAQRHDGDLHIHHPRFLSIPRYGKGIEPASYLRAIEKALDGADPSGFDIVDMHWTFPDLPAGLALARRWGRPGMVTLRGMEALHRQDGGVRERLVRDGIAAVDGVVSLSTELKRNADQIRGGEQHSVVIRNGVDVDTFSYREQRQCRSELGMTDDELSIVAVGSLIYRKGVDLLISAAAALRERFERPLRVYVVGSEGPEGDYRSELHRQVDALQLGEVFRFVGQVDNAQLPMWYNACDLFCLASRGEGSPNVLTEALACGCPAVSTDVGSAREIIESEPGTGLCVPVDDLAALEAALAQQLANPVDRQSAAERFSRYSWDWCAQQVLAQYQALAGR